MVNSLPTWCRINSLVYRRPWNTLVHVKHEDAEFLLLLLSLVWRWWYGALPSHGKESGLAEGVGALLHCEHWVAHLLGPGVHHLCHHHIPVATSLLVRMHGRMDMHLHCSVFRSTEIFLIHHHTCMYIYMFSNSMSTLEKKHATLSQGDLYRTYRLF